MYALEIYTVIAMLLITLVAMFMDELTVIQQFAVWVRSCVSCTNGKKAVTRADSLI